MAVSFPTLTLLALLSLLGPAPLEARRMHKASVQVHTRSSARASGLRSILSESDTICGGPDIWSLITADPSVEGVQNIKWGKAHAFADKHVDSEEANIQMLEVQLEDLQISIEKVRDQERVLAISKDSMRGLIQAGLATFGGVEPAQRTACGRPGLRPRLPRGTFDRSIEAFKAAATEVFQGETRLEGGDALIIECKKLLDVFPHEDDEYCGPSCQEGSYCPDLCQRFKDEAQALSDFTVGANVGASLVDLQKQKLEAVDSLMAAKESIAQCRQAKETMTAFQSQLEGLKMGISERFTAVREAEFALDDAMYDLEDLSDVMEASRTEMDSMVAALKAANVSVADAEGKVSALRDQEQDLAGKMSDSLQGLAKARQQLEGAKEADNAVGKLRSAVSAVALKMHLFFDKAALEPTRSTGITEALNVSNYFVEDPKTMETSIIVSHAVKSLGHFCQTEARASFEAVKDDVDLSPLCAIGNPCHITLEINEAVEQLIGKTKSAITQVQSWFNPYKGHPGLTKERVAENVALGEPVGLSEIVSVYKKTNFYKYLKHWKVNGEFAKLIAMLKGVVSALDTKFAELTQEIAELRGQSLRTVRLREEAQRALGEARSARDLEASRKAELEAKLEELSDRSEKMKRSVASLEAQLEVAKEAYQKARISLRTAHEEGTSFLETLSEAEVDASESLYTQQEISALRADLAGARRALEAADSRVRVAQRG